MDGKIWVESDLGKGATFIFTVKTQYSTETNTDANSNTSGGNAAEIEHGVIFHGEFAGKRLLVAEDIEINREIVIAFLEGSGLAIDCAETGKEAFEMITENPGKYDIVLMDLQMPQMGGLEATLRIRAFEGDNGKAEADWIPIIAMTANVFKDDIDACRAAGMNDHLGKPLDIGKVLEILRNYLKTGR